MGDSSLRIVGSVLGLRRFTLSELVHNANVQRSAAVSWLRRNSGDFVALETVATGGAGRPRQVWRLTAEAEARYTERLARIAPARLQAAVFGTDRPAVARLEALEEAETYLALALDCGDAEVRAEALGWAAQWTEAAARRVIAHEEAGDEVETDVMHRLVRAQLQTSSLQREDGPWTDQTVGDPSGLPTAVFDIARRWVAELESWPLAEGRLLWELSQPAVESPRGLEAVGTLAALGLLTSVKVTSGARWMFAQRVHALSPAACVDGLKLLDRSLGHTWSTDAGTMFVVICAGIEQHPGLLGDPRVNHWLDASIVRAENHAAVKGAYLQTRLHTPGARCDEIFGFAGVPQAHAANMISGGASRSLEGQPEDPDGPESDALATAQHSLLERGIAYYHAASVTHGASGILRSGCARFRSTFLSEERDEVGMAF